MVAMLRALKNGFVLLIAATALTWPCAQRSTAQEQPLGMAMTLLPVVHQGSQDFIITPRGYHVAIPGTGIARDAKQVAIYQDPQGN